MTHMIYTYTLIVYDNLICLKRVGTTPMSIEYIYIYIYKHNKMWTL